MVGNVNVRNNKLSNSNASYEAKKLFQYICSIYGNKILSGQQESDWKAPADDELDYIKEKTGRLPAIRGLDYINDDYEGVNKRSIEWWEKGGIVSICWHWGTPPDGIGYESSKGTIDLEEALTEGTDLYNGMIAKMDEVAVALKELQDARVPILWRPFHEFDGAWFWWGKGGAVQFIKLWRLMYDRYTNYHGLTNLIWVLGYSGEVKKGWFPGYEYVDIAGADTYNPGPQTDLYQKVFDIVGRNMPIAFHECGPIPNPVEMINDGAKWVWFLTWHTIHVKEQNTPNYLSAIYNHEYVITLDKVPNLKFR
ncbi:glycosyl hydrolase [Gracilibacillus sp. HCP3S3_G5_1]|uniref:glycosyl hydrolase n=1 Tax=unclassified Gracilibacillus TaxID=2625209 RepID=UPI003F8995AA